MTGATPTGHSPGCSTGGYVYQYRAAPLSETKARLHEGLDRWAAQVHDRIDAFEEHSGAAS